MGTGGIRVAHRGRCAAGLAAALALGASAPALAADPVLPLSEVRAGMVGDARTVVHDADIGTFTVTVLDVVRLSDGPGDTVILARASGPLMERTGGVAKGMSGSPVYVTGQDGVARVIGAVSMGTGDEANTLIGITPIEQMTGATTGARENARSSVVVRRATEVSTRAAARALEARLPASIGLYPLRAWSVAGVSRSVQARLSAPFRSATRRAASIYDAVPPLPLVPGAGVAVLLAAGDITVGAFGTVTMVDGDRVLAFGHGLMGAGRVRFLMADAVVDETVSAPASGESYRISVPGALRGTVLGDRIDVVSGRIGPAAGIAGTSTATDAARGTASTVRATIAPDPRTASQMVGMLQDEPAHRVTDGAAPGTVTLRVSIAGPDLARPLVIRDVYASSGDVAGVASGRAAGIVDALMVNDIRPVAVSSVDIDQRIERAVRAARILRADVVGARRGSRRATLVLRVEPWRAGPRIVRLPVTLPEGVTPASPALRVVPSSGEGFSRSGVALHPSGDGDAAWPWGGATGAGRIARRATGTRLSRTVGAIRAVAGRRNDAVRLIAGAGGPDQDEGLGVSVDATAGVVVPVPWVVYEGSATTRVVFRR